MHFEVPVGLTFSCLQRSGTTLSSVSNVMVFFL